MALSIGLNILAQSVSDRHRLFAVLDTLQPSCVVVMDDMQLAQAIRQRLPTCIVVHRSWHPNDHEFHNQWSPQQFVDAYCTNVPQGIVVQVLNEPSGYTDLRPLAAWCASVITLAAARGVRVAVPNLAVGHPDDVRVKNGELDVLLRTLSTHINCYLALHEYLHTDPRVEPWLVTRFKAIDERCRTLGINPPKKLITEAGRDVGGGVNDGWRAVFTEERYAEKLIQQAQLYAPYNVVGMAVFCYGKGGGERWQSFDVEGANTVLDRVAAYNREVRTVTQIQKWATHDWGNRVNNVITSMTSVNNVRTLPSATSPLSAPQLKNGDVLDAYYTEPYKDGTYSWYRIVRAGKEEYTTSLSNLTFKAAPPPIDNGNVLLPITTLNQILDATERMGELGERMTQDAAELNILRTEIVRRFSGLLKG